MFKKSGRNEQVDRPCDLPRWWQRWPLLIIAAFGTIASLLIFVQLKRHERVDIQRAFAKQADERVDAIHDGLQQDIRLLEAAVAFYNSSQKVERSEFDAFVGALVPPDETSLLSLAWVPQVSHQQRQAFEDRVGQSSGVEVAIHELDDRGVQRRATERLDYYPAEFTTEFGWSQTGRSVGFDYGSDPVRMSAMMAARDTGKATVSSALPAPGVDGVATTGHELMVAAPIYRSGAATSTVDLRHKNLVGFVVAVVRMSDVMTQAFANLSDSGIACRVIDAGDVSYIELVRDPRLRPAEPGAGSTMTVEGSKPLRHQVTREVAGRPWTFEAVSTPQFLAGGLSWGPWLALTAGLLATIAIMVGIRLSEVRELWVRELVAKRTAELHHANDQLAEHMNHLTQSNKQLEAARVKLKRQASIDPLTGVMNRQTFSDKLASQFNRAVRNQEPLACILLDLDFFKKINDTHGHPVGDQVLRSVAKLLQERADERTSVARYGGEEFCILMEARSESEAAEWAEQMRLAMGQLEFRAGEVDFRISGSFGVAQLTSRVPSPESLVEATDEALLFAKRRRNRVITYGATNQPGKLGHGVFAVFKQSTARDLMTPAVARLRPEQSLHDAARLLLMLRLESAPVINDDEELVGVIGEDDLTSQILAQGSWDTQVADVMSNANVCFDESESAESVYAFLSRLSIRRVVVTQDGIPTGIVSRANLIRWFDNLIRTLSDADPHTSDDRDYQLRSSVDALAFQVDRLQLALAELDHDSAASTLGTLTQIQELADHTLSISSARPNLMTTPLHATIGHLTS